MSEKIRIMFLINVLLVISLACSLPENIIGSFQKPSTQISSITFCEEVTDVGECIEPGNTFPAGTQSVYAYFTYQNMKDGQIWSRTWLQDDELYNESVDEPWDNGSQGWVAYSIDEPNGLHGQFTFTIKLVGKEVQTASFNVEGATNITAETDTVEMESFPAFGPITMAEDAAENAFPIGAAKEFVHGILKVAAIFPYANMTPDLTYTAEWIWEGKTLISQEYPWEDSVNGMHYTSLVDDTPLAAGKYSLNLYLQNELVRTTNFEIIGEPPVQPAQPDSQQAANAEKKPERPATPDEVVDPDALKYFYRISEANLPVLNQVVKDNLAGWTKIKIVDNNPCGEDAVACFSKSCDKRWGGTVYLPRENITGVSDVDVTATLTHELTHGMEYYDGMRCGCSVQKEFYAMAAEMDYVYYSDHTDEFDQMYGGLWDANGKIDTGKLWDIVKGAYGDDCPEY